jgi:cytoskeletal protein CcmA (bactofilin family)
MTTRSPQSFRQKSGASLPTVIMVVALMMTLAFTVVAIAFNHLNLSFRANNNTRAEHLAEATLALAIEKAREDIDVFGISGTLASKTLVVTLDSLPAGSRGVLSFDVDQAAALGVPYSTNNRSENSVEGSNPNQPVPGQSLHLVARGEVGGAFSTMEAIVYIPKFPYSIASEGAIRSDGGLTVAAVRPGTLVDLSAPVHPDDLLAGHLVTNSTIGEAALVLDGSNTIMGDVQSASDMTIGEDTVVHGETRTFANKASIPQLDARNYDPLEVDGADVQPVNTDAGTLRVKGYNVFGESHTEGSLTVDNGISLEGGVLYVNGDLTVHSGGVHGKGAIIATGNITILGGGEATTDNQAALVANGDIHLRGTPYEKAKFAGLVYAGGNLKSENMRLAGVFVAGGEQSEVVLKDTELYQVAEYAKLEIQQNSGFELPQLQPQEISWNGHPFQGSYDLSGVQANLENYRNPNTGPGQPEYLFKFKVEPSSYMTYTFNSDGTVVMSTTTGPDQYLLDGGLMGMSIFGQTVHSEAEAEAVVLARMAELEGRELDETEKTAVRNLAHTFYQSNQPLRTLSMRSAEYSAINGGPSGGDGSVTQPFVWSLDMSEFFGDVKPMQILTWVRYRS